MLNIFWIHLSKIEPVADQKTVNEMAKKIVTNNIEELKQDKYLELNPQQIGTSFFIATIYKVCNTTNYRIIQYLNVVSNIISIITIFFILKQFLNEYKFNEWIYFIVNLTFIPFILLSTFVYGDYVGLMFSVIAVYMIMKYTKLKKIRYLLISAILLGISYIIKSNYLIFILAFIIYLFLDFLEDRKWNKFIGIILLILISILPNTILKQVIGNKLELNKNRSIPSSAYIYMGMNEGSRQNGWYNSTMDYVWQDIDDSYSYYPSKIKERVVELVKSPFYTAKFYTKKIISMWTEVTFGGIWYNLPFQANDHEEFLNSLNENALFASICKGKANSCIVIYQKALVILIFFGALASILCNRKRLSLNIVLLITIFLGGFFFHIIWEAKSRYILPYLYMLIPISVIGVENITKYLLKKVKEGKYV